MLKTAIRSARAAGVRQRIDFRAGDASDFDPVHLFGTESFDRIVLSYALSMIPPWQRTIDHALRHLAPGGSLHIVDFGQQREIPQIARHALRSWLARFHVTPRSRLFDVVSTAAERRGACVSFDPLYRDYAWLIVVRMPESGSRDTGD
jgi:S-adenosylmethionine-diacylgycerolhomoserine-N-methlytransferase